MGTSVRLDPKTIEKDVKNNEKQHLEMLEQGLKASFTDLASFQDWIGEKMREMGMDVNEFTVDQAELAGQKGYQKLLKEDPDQLKKGPNMVGHLRGNGTGGGILLYAHADKRPETYAWGREHPNMILKEGRLYGIGIADDVCGLTAMLSAVETFTKMGFNQGKDIVVASILGKQMGVFGTYGLMTRYEPMDAAIYVHPAESGDGLSELKMASCGMLEFIIEVKGKSPDTSEVHHTIYSNSAVNAAEKAVYLFQGLQEWAKKESKHHHHQGLEKLTGQVFSLMIGRINTGIDQKVFEIPLSCVLEGTICFPPNSDLESVQKRFKNGFDSLVNNDPWLSGSNTRLKWGNLIGDSVQSDENGDVLKMASNVVYDLMGKNPSFFYGHTLSDIRYPLIYWNTQAFGIGPLAGNIGQVSEWVDKNEYLQSIVIIAQMIYNMT